MHLCREDLCTKQTLLSAQGVLHRERAHFATGLKISEFFVLTLQFNRTIVSFECGLDKVQRTDSHRGKKEEAGGNKRDHFEKALFVASHTQQDLLISTIALSSSLGIEFN